MRKIKGWIHDFDNLNSDHKLEVAEAIIEYLKTNNLVFDMDQYYRERTGLVCDFLGDLLYCYKGDGNLKKLGEMLYKFDNLSEKNQKELVDEIIYAFQKRIIIQKDDDNKDYCLVHGHNFGEWKYSEWTEYIDTVIDHELVHDFPIKHSDWKRKCSKCGFVEMVHQEPDELYKARMIKEKKAKIKKLTKELKKLEKE